VKALSDNRWYGKSAIRETAVALSVMLQIPLIDVLFQISLQI
jgi:hypothetical protein